MHTTTGTIHAREGPEETKFYQIVGYIRKHKFVFIVTVALLYHILHHNLLPCTVTSLNLTHTSSTIVHHLLPALSHNHQLICWRITDCSLFLRTRSSPIPPVESIKKEIASSRSTTDSLSNSTSSYSSLTVKLTIYILIFVFFWSFSTYYECIFQL